MLYRPPEMKDTQRLHLERRYDPRNHIEARPHARPRNPSFDPDFWSLKVSYYSQKIYLSRCRLRKVLLFHIILRSNVRMCTVQSGYTGSGYTGILPITENSGVSVLIYMARPESLVSAESDIFLIFFTGGRYN
jgi:hypothetical protein